MQLFIKFPLKIDLYNFCNYHFFFTTHSKQNSDLMDELVRHIRQLNCPNFWIPTINLFEDLREMAESEEDGFMKIERLVKIVREIQGSRQKAVIDQWVECSRCLMENCCFYECCNCDSDEIYGQDANHIDGVDHLKKLDVERQQSRDISNKKAANYEEKYRIDEDKRLAKITSDRRPAFSIEKRKGCCCGANCREWRHEFDHY